MVETKSDMLSALNKVLEKEKEITNKRERKEAYKLKQ